MNRLHAVAWAGFAAAAALLQPTDLHARESDSEFWLELSAQGKVAPGAEAKFEVEERFRDGANEYIVGAVVDVEVAERTEVGGGMEIHDIAGFTEVRPYQQLTFQFGDFSFRSRVEERFFDNADQLAIRLRQRAQFSPALGSSTRARLSAELLYQLRDRVENGPQRIDQWRFTAGVQQRIAPAVSVTAGYMFQIRPRPDGQTRHTHVPQVALAYSF